MFQIHYVHPIPEKPQTSIRGWTTAVLSHTGEWRVEGAEKFTNRQNYLMVNVFAGAAVTAQTGCLQAPEMYGNGSLTVPEVWSRGSRPEQVDSSEAPLPVVQTLSQVLSKGL